MFYLESSDYAEDDTPLDPEVTGDDTTTLLDATANALVVSLHVVVSL
jgi:hypothetical protein